MSPIISFYIAYQWTYFIVIFILLLFDLYNRIKVSYIYSYSLIHYLSIYLPLSGSFILLYAFFVAIYHRLTSVWKNSLGISCKEFLVVMNSLNLWFVWEKSLSLQFWRTVFFIYNILGKKHLSFSNLKYASLSGLQDFCWKIHW